jgi:hypothetical protein
VGRPDPEAREAVLHAVELWLAVQEREHPGRRVRSADVRTSSLLRWILDGNEPLAEPPPRIEGRLDHLIGAGAARRIRAPEALRGVDSRTAVFGTPVPMSQVRAGDTVVMARSHWTVVGRDDSGLTLKVAAGTRQLYSFRPVAVASTDEWELRRL